MEGLSDRSLTVPLKLVTSGQRSEMCWFCARAGNGDLGDHQESKTLVS